MNPPRFYDYKAEVVSNEEPLANHYIIKFKLLEPTTIDFLPGQFVQAIVEGIPKPASFSIASSPQDKEHVELCFHMIGRVTGVLSKMTPGMTCTLRAPLGRFVYTAEDGDVVALAGGVGITPFMSAVRYVRDLQLPNKYTLLYSAKTKEGLTYFNELEEAAQKNDNIKVVFTATDEVPQEWAYETRRIDPEMIKEHVPDYLTRTYYLCGPKPFIDAMIEHIKSLGVPDAQVRRELW